MSFIVDFAKHDILPDWYEKRECSEEIKPGENTDFAKDIMNFLDNSILPAYYRQESCPEPLSTEINVKFSKIDWPAPSTTSFKDVTYTPGTGPKTSPGTGTKPADIKSSDIKSSDIKSSDIKSTDIKSSEDIKFKIITSPTKIPHKRASIEEYSSEPAVQEEYPPTYDNKHRIVNTLLSVKNESIFYKYAFLVVVMNHIQKGLIKPINIEHVNMDEQKMHLDDLMSVINRFLAEKGMPDGDVFKRLAAYVNENNIKIDFSRVISHYDDLVAT